MDKQMFSYYRKNTIYLFVIAVLLIAVSVLATVLVLVPMHMLIKNIPIVATILLWIALLFGTVLSDSKQTTIFNMIISIIGFVCSFVLAISMFINVKQGALSFFLFWISQILSAIFILASYFSVQAYLETKKKKIIKTTKTSPRKKVKVTTSR